MARNNIVGLSLSLAFIAACSGASLDYEDHHWRGSEEFKNSLRRGAGASRPAVGESSGSLSLTESRDGVFQVSMDPASQTWAWVTYDTRFSPAVATQAMLESWSRSFIENHRQDLGLAPDELVSFAKTVYEPLAGTTLVTFTRDFQSRAVKGAFVQLIFNSQSDGSYRLREVLNNSYGTIELSGETKAPAVQDAISLTGIDGLEFQQSRDVIFTNLAADGTYDFYYATEFALNDPVGSEQFWVTIDNNSHDILEAYSNRLYAKHELSLNTYTRSYVFKDEKPRPLPFFGIRDPANANLVLESDSAGVIDTTGTQATIVLQTPKSATGIVDVLTRPAAFYSFPVTLPAAGGKTTINLSQADPAALNTFLAVHEVTEYAKKFLNPALIPLLSQGIQSNVNLADQQNLFCNAFYDGVSLNFFRAGNGCANTSLINDVVYHEWGHALDNFTGVVTNPNGITDGAFSEGLGDIIGFLMTGNEVIGPGFLLNQPNSLVRNVQNTRKHPPANAQEAEVHSAGLIIGGAFWDLRKNLVALYGPIEGSKKTAQLLFQHMTMTDRYENSYQSVLRLADTDSNPATRAENYCSINKAFALHALTAGVVEGDSCIDVDLGIKLRVNIDNGKGSLSLFASAYSAESIVACPGKVAVCSESTPGFVAFVKDAAGANSLNGTAVNSKLFYEGKGTLNTAGADVFTFISKDIAGKLIGTRTVQFKARDQTADLSKTLK